MCGIDLHKIPIVYEATFIKRLTLLKSILLSSSTKDWKVEHIFVRNIFSFCILIVTIFRELCMLICYALFLKESELMILKLITVKINGWKTGFGIKYQMTADKFID